MWYKCFQSEFEFKNTCLKSLLGCSLPLLSRHFKEAIVTLCWIAFRDATKAIQYSMNSDDKGRPKLFTRIEHRAGAVGREGLVNSIPVLIPEYLLPS